MSIRVLHCGDLHLGELPGPTVNGENARMMDTVLCMNWVAEQAAQEQVDAILIAGDLFHRSKLWADQALKEIGLAVNWLRQLAAIAPTALMFGTQNHDNLQAFKTIESMRITNLFIVTEPRIVNLLTKEGPLQIACVPGFDKGYFRAQQPGMDPTEENRICSNLLGDIILGLGAQLDPAIPSVLMSHYTVVGCQLDNGEHVFMQSDVVLPIEALAASPYDLVCLGHIHRRQSVQNCGRPVYYCGSINRLSFNEESQSKGFLIHEITPAWCVPATEGIDADGSYGEVQTRFIDTPARWFTTVQAVEDSLTNWPALFAADPRAAFDKYAREIDPCKDAIVRFWYGGDEETRKKMNHKAIEKALYDAGAFYVSEIAPVKSEAALSKSKLNETADPEDNLAEWLLEQPGMTEAEEILRLARPLIAQVAANTPTGKLSGVFEPRRLEVKNYRSYKEEAFDFSSISFATVNGPNGVGKSALFMDAICDALYEEPREGDLAGWISNDEGAKSGSITFEFLMGDSCWRVVRTRSKSGKTTLALQQQEAWGKAAPPLGVWVDRSADKVRDTQDKIIALLGMDAMTFRCCALIMQDAYGLFMDAEKSDRMEVMGAVLGLGIYEQLTELAKAQMTEVNRSLQLAKTALAELDEKLKGRTEIHSVLAETEREIKDYEFRIEERQGQLRDLEDLIRQLEGRKEQAAQLQQQQHNLNSELNSRDQEKAGLDEQLARAQKMLDCEQQIMEKVAEYDQVKEQVTVLQTKYPRVQAVKNEYFRLVPEGQQIMDELSKKLDPEIRELERVLANRAEYEQGAAEYNDINAKLEAISEFAKQDDALRDQVMEVEKGLDISGEAWGDKRNLIEACKKKVEMLGSSGCIDPGNARCQFLSDAQDAADRLPRLLDELKQIEVDRAPFQKQVDDLEAKRTELGYDCNRHYDLGQAAKALRPKADLAALLSAKAETLEKLKAHRQQLSDRLHQIGEQQKSFTLEIDALAKELKSLTELQQRLPGLEKWAAGKDQLPAARQTVTMATERIAAIVQEIATKQEQRQQIEAEIHQLMIKTADLDIHRKNAQELTEHIKSQQSYLNTLHSKKGALNSRLEALAKDEETRRGLAEQMEPQAKALVRYQTLSKAFGGDGIPFAVVRSVVPELSSMANEILGQMTGGKMAMEMRTERVQKSNHKEVNALEIWITDYIRGSLPYKSRSGGQKVKAALSVAFALADLKARRAGIQLGMMFVDEPSFLDSEGVDAYCDALEMMVNRYSNMKVLAISHDPRMKARFPQVITVEDTGEQGSKVKIA